MKIGRKDARVLEAFSERRPEVGHKLRTDGARLDGLWVGGASIAMWSGDKIRLRPLDSKTAQSVQRSLMAYIAPNDIDTRENPVGKRRRNPDGRVLATTADDRRLLLDVLDRVLGELDNDNLTAEEQAYREKLRLMYHRIYLL